MPAVTPGTGTRAGTPASSAAGRGLRLTATGWVIIAATLISLGLLSYQLSRPGYLFGVTEYDDGTDFGSAVRLVHGLLPYRDFFMVQPPGITVLMAPVALATKGMSTITGMAAGRVLAAMAGAASVLLGGLLVRHRGLVATVVTCGILAVYPDSVAAAKTVLLEPWLVLFCLLGLVAVFDRDRLASGQRLVWGGVAFGFAGAIKVWAILPVVVILALSARDPRRSLRFAAGVTAGFLVPVLPFAAAAPTAFVRSVIITQLIRSDIRVPAGDRLQNMLGLTHVGQMPTPALIVIGAVVAVVIIVLAALAWRLTRRPPPALEWFALGTWALVVISFLWPPDFYYHYAAFLAPFLALAIALPVSRLLSLDQARVRQRRSPHRTGQRRSPHRTGQRRSHRLRVPWYRGAVVVSVLTVLALTGLQAAAESHQSAAVTGGEISAVERVIPPGACVLTDQVSYTIAIDRFISSVPGCSPMVDGIGADYSLSGGRNGENGAGHSRAVQRLWLSALHTAQYVWLTGQASRRIPWTQRLVSYFNKHFRLVSGGRDWLFAKRRYVHSR